MALFASQQKQDGLYCLLTVVKRPRWEDEITAEDDKPGDDASLSDSSSSSSDSASSDSSSSSSSSPSVATLPSKQRRARRRARRKQKEAESARLKRLKQRQNAPSLFTLNKHGATFGKQPDAPLPTAQSPTAHKGGRQVVLEDGYVSKRHFSVWCERGRWLVMDQGSLNGTFVRRRRRQRAVDEVEEGEDGRAVDVERCLLSYGYGYENSLLHIHDGYRLTLHRVFLLGGVELMVVAVLDDDSEEQSDRHHVLLQYTQRSAGASEDSAMDVLSARVDTSGATLGTAESCTLPLLDPSLLPHHASITYSDGRFYLTESLPPATHSSLSTAAPLAASTSTSASPNSSAASSSGGVWSRLSLKGEESVPHVLCSGDLIRAGFTEFQVDIRAIPPSNAGGYGFGTSGPLPSTMPASLCAYDVGVALDGNFLHTKEMQDRAVAVEGWGGRGGLFVGVFDGHQERVVADFAAASVHHNILEEVAAMENERWRQWRRKQGEERSEEGASRIKAKASAAAALAVEESVSHSTVSIASSTQNDALYDESSQTSSSSSVERRGAGRHQRLDSDRSEARIGSAYDPEDEDDEQHEDDSFDENERSDSRRPPLSISVHNDPLSISVHSPTSASSNSSQSHKLPSSPPLHAVAPSHSHSVCFAPSSSASPLPPPIDVSLACQRGYRRTSAQIRGLSDSALYSGSTAVSALLYHHYHPTAAASSSSSSAAHFSHTTLTVCNLGDSHAYLVTRSAMIELSYPHSAKDAGEQARVKAAGGKITANHRLAGCLEVTRALGDLGLVGFGLSDEPWVKELTVSEEDRWLLVCSDGVDVLGAREIEEAVREGEREGREADDIARDLVDRAIRRKSRDNISVVVVNLDPHTERQQKLLPASTGNSLAVDLSQHYAAADGSQVLDVTGAPPMLISPRSKQLLLSVTRPDGLSGLPSSAGLSIVTDSLDAYRSHDHLSSSAPPVEDVLSAGGSGGLDEARRRKSVGSGVHSQPVSANDREEVEAELLGLRGGEVLTEPSPLSHSVSSPAESSHHVDSGESEQSR